jgi:exopolyphosphatase/pppGpp-phosphohydrolase
MKPTDKIEAIRLDLIHLFGKDDAAVRAIELREKYLKVALDFEELRTTRTYEDSLYTVCERYKISESTAKRALKFAESLVHKNELTTE